MHNELKVKIDTKEVLKLDEILKIQGDLKELPEKQYEKFKTALLDVGFCSPFHIWKNKQYNECLDGTQRLKTLLKMKQEGIKMPDAFPVIYVNAKSKKEARKILLSLASNYGKASKEGFDAFLIDSDFVIEDVSFADFPEFDIDVPDWDKEACEVEGQDDIPEVDEKNVVTKLGDIIELGEHRLLCGDCTVKENVDNLMDGKKADMVFTDPPYGVSIKNTKGAIMGDKTLDVFIGCLEPIKENTKKDSHIYIYYGVQYSRECIEYISKHFKQTNILVQRITHENKPSPDGYFKSNYEMCFFSNPEKKPFVIGQMPVSDSTLADSRYNGDGRAKTYLALTDIKATEHNLKSIHPTQKTVAICEFYQKISSKNNNIILDTFLGSGSTLIACEKTNRKCYGMELDPHYCDVIVKRWCDFTGNTEFKRNGVKEAI